MSDENKKFKRCPCCGKVPGGALIEIDLLYGGKEYFVEHSCNWHPFMYIRTKNYKTKEEAIAAWNERAE